MPSPCAEGTRWCTAAEFFVVLVCALCLRIQWGESTGTLFELILTLSEPACLLTKGWPMGNTRAGMHAPVFLMVLHRQEQQCCRLPRLKPPNERLRGS